MCGIFGSVGPPISLQVTAQIFAALKHRGPEGQSAQTFPGATLLHTRLRINDLSPAGAQPMANEDGSVWVTFNGEIYNFGDLRLELENVGHQFRSRSDTEVLLHGYEEWGDDVIHHLDGMFGFGIWDCRLQRLLLARDRAGKKPLFYAEHEGGLYFASEMKALFAAGVPRVPAAEGIAAFVAYGYAAMPATPYERVFELPPAHVLTFRPASRVAVRRYWQVNFDASFGAHSGTAAPSESEAAARVRELLTAAVKKRLVADVPVGAFLSGGFDSTAIVGLIAELGKRVHTFSIASAEPTYDESGYARLVARHFGTQHHELEVAPADFQLLDRLTWHYDGPVGDSSAIPTFALSKLAREHVTVALTGDGGDEVFAGYLRFGAASLTESLPKPLRPILRWAGAKLPKATASRSLLARAKRMLDAVGRPMGDRITLWTSPFAFALDQLLVPSLAHDIDQTLAFHRKFFPTSTSRSPLGMALDHNFSTYLPSDLLVKVDRCTMAHALEARSPFLDHALITYAMGLPDSFKWRGRTGKFIARKALTDLVPPQIANRGKMGFGIPLAKWFREQLRPYVCDHLCLPTSRLWQYVQAPFVGRLVSEHMSCTSDHSHQLWTLLALEVWLQGLGKSQPLNV